MSNQQSKKRQPVISCSKEEMDMDEKKLQQYIEQYFIQNAESLQEEIKELQKDYVKRKLHENHDKWLRQMQKENNEWVTAITELLKSVYRE